MTKEAIYIRTSTDDDRQDPETQRQSLKKICSSEDPAEYVDRISGADFDRPALKELLDDCRNGEINRIYITELSRIGRNSLDVQTTVERLKNWGVDLRIQNLGVNLNSVMGRLLIQILASIAELEREQLRERVKRGLERAKKEGKDLGRPAKEIEENTLEKVHKLRNLSDPPSWDEIADRVGESKSTIYRKYRSWKQNQAEA